jgi:aminoglycoside/choline kinase family phosphotransferase
MHRLLARLFQETFGVPPTSVTKLTPDGSQREYFRLAGGPHAAVIGAHGPDSDENRAFLSFSRSFRDVGLPVPEIYAAREEHGLWLEQDLGDTTLFQALTAAREREPGVAFPASMLEVYERVVRVLPAFQTDGGRVIDFSVAYPRAAFDEQSMLWDLNYFKYHFLKLARVPFSEQRLENDFHQLVSHLLATDTSHFLYRDFQSRNIMLLGQEPWFLDYQGGRRGALHYDIASLLYDAKADLPDPVRERLLERYLDALEEDVPVDRRAFIETYRGYVLIRIMQAMGAYGYRGFFERKPRFLDSVPFAARNIRAILEAGLPYALPEIQAVFERIVHAYADRAGHTSPRGLRVHVSSFSYHRGLPPDESGHGGGFVFDCRALPNPGRHAEFVELTGLDPSVIRWLEACSEIPTFWAHVTPLVDAHVSNFRTRGFTDLAVAFGCTGGQHRSVYFAERIARHIRETWPDVVVRLSHAESERWPRASVTDDEPDEPAVVVPPARGPISQ